MTREGGADHDFKNIDMPGATGQEPHNSIEVSAEIDVQRESQGERGKTHVGETLLDAVTAGDHLNMNIQMEEENFTMWMCLCNQHNNSILCVKHIFLS